MTRRDLVRRVDRGILRIEQGVLAAGVLGIAAVGIANVLARNLAGGSLPFAEEVSQALMLWITFAGLGLGARRARHIRMSALQDQLRGRARKRSWMAICAGTSLLLAVFALLAVRYVASTFAIGGVTPALRVPVALVYLVVPVGLLLGSVEYALTFLRNATSREIFASCELPEAGLEEEGAA